MADESVGAQAFRDCTLCGKRRVKAEAAGSFCEACAAKLQRQAGRGSTKSAKRPARTAWGVIPAAGYERRFFVGGAMAGGLMVAWGLTLEGLATAEGLPPEVALLSGGASSLAFVFCFDEAGDWSWVRAIPAIGVLVLGSAAMSIPALYPLLSPALIARGQGSHVWDVDGNEFIEYGMGCRAVTLGHAFQPVVEAARQAMQQGLNFARPAPIELECAEELLGMIDGADMAKFAKDGSNVTTAALKLARAYTGRDLIAFCSDHPFF